MSKTLRLLGAMAIATATVPFIGVQPALADEATLVPSTSGYFYAEGIRKPDESPAAPPNVTANLDGVAKDHLAVAARAGQEDKVSFLLFDLLEIVPGSMVTKATLTLPLAPNEQKPEQDGQNASVAAAPEKVRACKSGDEGFNGDDGMSIQDAPQRKCKEFAAPAKATADGKAYTFDITKLAQQWVDAENDGVALTAAEGAMSTPFQVVFQPAAKATLALTYTPGATESIDAPIVAPPVLDTGGTGSTDLGGGFSGDVLPAPPADSGFGAVASPSLPEAAAPAPAAGVAPQAAAPQTTPAAAAGPVDLETLQPTTAFWLGGLVLAGVLLLLSLIMGDSTVAVASSRPSRLSRALADRQRGAGSALSRPSFGRPITA